MASAPNSPAAGPREPRGLFVTLEGGEGAGKGSTLDALERTLDKAGWRTLVTREPGGAPETSAIRSLVVERGGADWTPVCELLLLMADRAQHVARVIAPALAQGQVVLCDRFEASTFAYQGAGKGIEDSAIASLQSLVAPGLTPDLTILLDVDPSTGLSRSARRLRASASREDRFEAMDAAFHARVRASFLDQARKAPQRWIVIDSNRPLSDVVLDATSKLERWLAERAQSS